MFKWKNLNCQSQVEKIIHLLRFQIYIHMYNSYLAFSKKAFAKRHTFVEEKWVRLSTESVHSLHLLEDYFLDIAQAPFLYQSSNLIFTSAFIDVSRTKFNPIMRCADKKQKHLNALPFLKHFCSRFLVAVPIARIRFLFQFSLYKWILKFLIIGFTFL